MLKIRIYLINLSKSASIKRIAKFIA